VVTSAILWGGVPRLLLQAAREKRIALYTSMPMLAELSGILARQKFARKIAASLLTIEQIVDGYAQLTALVRPPALAGIAPDADDDVVIATALAAKADFLVTGDKPLLSVGRYQGVRIIQVVEAIQLIEMENQA
jgi:putative PIN family toxin of toxin-antitoxin system